MTLNLHDVETFEIACPPTREEADDIVTILEAIEAKANLHLRKRDARETLLDSVLHELLSGQTSVAEFDLSVLSDSLRPWSQVEEPAQ